MESGKIIVVANQKGGVAKTSTVRNLSYALAEMGKKVLVVDFDPQYNLTTSFGVLPTQAPYNTGTLITNLLLDESLPDTNEFIQKIGSVDLIPSSRSLTVAEANLLMTPDSNDYLAALLNPLRLSYDYIMVALPYSSEDGRELGYDFTVYTGNDSMDGGDVGDDGMWTAPTAEQLAAHVWTWQGDLAEQPAMATMSLTQGSGAEPGQITFTWWYTKDYGDPQEIYEGSWSLTDGGEHIDLTMTRSGGRQYTKGEAPTTVSGMFPVQVPAAFDVFPVLNVSGGGGAYGFPIQQFPYELLMFNPAQG